MDIVTREEVVTRLKSDWGQYVAHYQCLSADEQKQFLQRQGYARFADLLGHIIAWWEEGARGIAARLSDPNLPMTDYDVDAFNAQAVQRFAGQTESEVIAAFEAQRATMLELVNALSAEQIQQKNVNMRLVFEVMNHWNEHAL